MSSANRTTTWRLGVRRSVTVACVTLLLAACGSSDSTASLNADRFTISFQALSGQPFGVITAGRYAFVDLLGGRVLVLSTAGARPRPVGSFDVPGEALGGSLTQNGRYLLIANGRQGATVINVAAAESGDSDPVVGTLAPPGGSHLHAGGAIETASSADGRYVFVSLEYGTSGASAPGAIAVYDLGSALHPRVGPRDYVGAVTLGMAVVGTALSPDGRYLYATSEVSRLSTRQLARLRTRARTTPAATRSGALLPDGTLSVISVSAAEHDPSRAVITTVPAKKQPVRVVVSPDGRIVWVTARASDRLLAFSSTKLRDDPSRALIATVPVGTAPVGLALLDHGRRVIVADSDRFNAARARPALTIVAAAVALNHQPAVLATLRASGFPREIAVESDGRTALVTNFASGQLEIASVPGTG